MWKADIRIKKHSQKKNDSWKQEVHNFYFEYEAGIYKDDKIIRIVDSYICEFALSAEEIAMWINHVEAWERIYSYADSHIEWASKKIKAWMFGEAIMFCLLKDYFPEAKKLVTKIRLRSTNKSEVHWFDCAHYELNDWKLRLRLWEAKFYESFSWALSAAYESLKEHLNIDKIRDEFVFLSPNLESNKEENRIIRNFMEGPITNIEYIIPIFLSYNESLIKQCNSTEDLLKKIWESYNKKWESILKKNFESINQKINIKYVFMLLAFNDIEKIKNKLAKRKKSYLA